MEEEVVDKTICEYKNCDQKVTHELMWGETVIARYCKNCARRVKHILRPDYWSHVPSSGLAGKDRWGARTAACTGKDHLAFSSKYNFCPVCGKNIQGWRGR